MDTKEILELVERLDFEKRKEILRELDEYRFDTKTECLSLMKKILKISKQNSLEWHQKDFMLSIIRRIDFLCTPYIFGDRVETIRKKFNVKIKDEEKRNYDYNVILDALKFSMNSLLDNDGRVRISAVHTLNSLRSCLRNEDYIELYFDLLSIAENEKDRKKIKNIKRALEKLSSPHLAFLVVDYMPDEIKECRIITEDTDSNEKKELAKNVEDYINSMIMEVRGFEKKIRRMRYQNSQYDFTPYLINLSLIQTSYEIQKSMTELINSRTDSDEKWRFFDCYMSTRLYDLVKKHVKNLEKLKSVHHCCFVDIDIRDGKPIIKTLEFFYNKLKEFYENLEMSKRFINNDSEIL